MQLLVSNLQSRIMLQLIKRRNLTQISLQNMACGRQVEIGQSFGMVLPFSLLVSYISVPSGFFTVLLQKKKIFSYLLHYQKYLSQILHLYYFNIFLSHGDAETTIRVYWRIFGTTATQR